MKKGKIIQCKITEIHIDEITYRDYDNLEGPNIIIRKADVNKIHYQNGKVVNLASEEAEVKKETEIINKNQSVKFIILSPLFENLGFVYERKLKMGLNLEMKAGYIGIGNNISNLLGNKNNTGAFICGGVKLILGQKSHDYYIDGVKFLHPLKGRYIKPELIFSTIKYTQVDYSYNSVTEVTYRNNLYGITIIFGKQYFFGKSITFDPYFGVGFGYISTKKISGTTPYFEYTADLYNFGGAIMLMNEIPVLVTGGFTLGYIFK